MLRKHIPTSKISFLAAIGESYAGQYLYVPIGIKNRHWKIEFVICFPSWINGRRGRVWECRR